MELWPDPRFGLPASYTAWEWTEVEREHGGKTKHPPTSDPGWQRWYFYYETADGDRMKVSADRDPITGDWFNPHFSSKP